MRDADGIQLLVLLIGLSLLAGAIAVAVSPEAAQWLRPWQARAAQWLRPWQARAAQWLRPADPLGRPATAPLPWMLAGTHPPPSTGDAADQPPSGLGPLLRQLAWLDRRDGGDPLRLAIGWRVRPHGGLWLECATFSGGRHHPAVVNVLISGQIGSGKDVLARAMLLPLMLRASPDALNLVIIDGKGLDYVSYAGLPHLRALANDIPDIPPLLAWLDEERARRKTLLRAVGVKTWHAAPAVRPFPLLLVYISELTTLERFVERFWEWVNDHLSLDRALGICYVIGTQTASNTPTRWRRQLQLFVAGYQPASDDDRPNTTLAATRWPAGVVPPSGLPLGGGYFTVVLGRAAYNVRGAYITDAEERQALAAIRRRWGAAPPAAEPVRADRSRRAALLAALAAEPLSRDELVWFLACQRAPDTGDWRYSANKIADLVGGTRATILKLVSDARAEIARAGRP